MRCIESKKATCCTIGNNVTIINTNEITDAVIGDGSHIKGASRISNCTISGNRAMGNGGGIYLYTGSNISMSGNPVISTGLFGVAGSNFQYNPTADDMRALRYKWPDPADTNMGWLYVSDRSSRYGSDWTTSSTAAFSYTGLDNMTQSLNYLRSLRSVKLITDYAPRMEGSRRYLGTNQPTVDIGYEPLTSGVRPTYRDRHYILHGYDVSEEFYSPCYRQRPLPSLQDYRRTLYWNPNLELDENGRANVVLWNNSLSTSITVSAEGITPTGKILTGISYPEDR